MGYKYKFQGKDPAEVVATWGNKRFGSWTSGTNVRLEKCTWFIDVTCDCGEKLEVAISGFSRHKKCNCKRMNKTKKKHLESLRGYEALEKIWPEVIKAGQKVMRKYYAMA